MARVSASEIRTRAHEALAIGLRARIGQTPYALGTRLLRQGRWMLADTTTAGTIVLVEVTEDGLGGGVCVGPAATIRNTAPSSLRDAWVANQTGEGDEDPASAKTGGLR